MGLDNWNYVLNNLSLLAQTGKRQVVFSFQTSFPSSENAFEFTMCMCVRARARVFSPRQIKEAFEPFLQNLL